MKTDLQETEILGYWVRERELIRELRRLGHPKPWSPDPIMRDYRWCNVRRMDDAVSQWLMRKWYPRMADQGEDVLTAAALARLINWPDSLAMVHSISGARQVLTQRFDAGMKTFTSAYIVPGVPGFSKVDSVCHVVADVWRGVKLQDSMEATWHALRHVNGLGSFLSGQIVADVAELPEGADWKDSRAWAPPGPGSVRGLNRLLGRAKDKSMTYAEFQDGLALAVTAVAQLATAVYCGRELTAMDVQNCLCEYDKYRRLQLGEGQVRANYPGLPAPDFFT